MFFFTPPPAPGDYPGGALRRHLGRARRRRSAAFRPLPSLPPPRALSPPRLGALHPHPHTPFVSCFSFFGTQARELNEQLRNLSDVRFTDTNRVPHAFQTVVRSKLKLGFIAAESDGPYIIDVDGAFLVSLYVVLPFTWELSHFPGSPKLSLWVTRQLRRNRWCVPCCFILVQLF